MKGQDFKTSLNICIYFIVNQPAIFLFTDNEKVSDYSLKLLDLDCEQLGIPVSNLRNTKPLITFLQHCKYHKNHWLNKKLHKLKWMSANILLR